MSELSKAWGVVLRGLSTADKNQRSLLKAVFHQGWDARQALADKRISEIVNAAILAERERCAKICDDADKNTHPADLADMIRSSHD